MIVFGDYNQRQPLDRGEIHSFVERACAGAAIADIGEPDNVFLLQAGAQEDTRHHRDHIAEMRDRAEETLLEVTKVNIEIFSARRSPRFGHVLRQNLARTNTFDEHCAEIANDWGDEIIRTQRVSRTNCRRFLTE